MTARTTHRRATTAALGLSMFMAALEMTVVTTAMPSVVGDLGGLRNYAWVFTGYLLSSTIAVPLFGKLADLYGRKPIILGGISLFSLASIACGLAGSIEQLIVFRTLQGIGAGAMQPMAMTITGDLYSVAERGRIQGAFAAIWGLSALLGPSLGALIVDHATWRWIFLLNVPAGVGALVVLSKRYHEELEQKERVLDLKGAGLLTVAVACLLLGAEGTGRPWTLWVVVPLLALFIAVERRAPEPLLPPSLFRIRAVVVASLAATLYSAAMFGALTYLPLYVQAVLGGSPSEAGRIITPMLIGWPLAATVGGRLLPKVGYRALILPGLALASMAGMGIASFTDPETPRWLLLGSVSLLGVGLGLTNTPLLIAIQSNVGWSQRGVATASNVFFRSIGATVGVGTMGGLVAAMLAKVPGAPEGAADALLGPDPTGTLSPELVTRMSGALEGALELSFTLVALCALGAFCAALAFPRLELSDAPPAQGPTGPLGGSIRQPGSG